MATMNDFSRRSALSLGIASVAVPAVAALPIASRRYRLGASNDVLESEIKALLASKQIPGGNFAAIADGRIIWAKSFGKADLAADIAMSLDHLWVVASITKTMVTTVLMQLHEQGHISIDADISDYLPYIVRHPLHPERTITIRHILTHSGGTSPEAPIAYDATYAAGEYPPHWKDDAEAWFSTKGLFHGPKNPFFAEWGPGDRSEYSSAPFILLSHVIEVVTGHSFFDQMRNRLFTPLGMHSTAFRHADIDSSRQARQYGRYVKDEPVGEFTTGYRHLLDLDRRRASKTILNGNIAYQRFGWPAFADGGVQTSITDLAQYVIAWLDQTRHPGGRLLSPSTVEEMFRSQIDPARLFGTYGPWFRQGIGFRYQFQPAQGYYAWGHNGGDCGTRATMQFDRNRKIAVLAMVNQDNVEPPTLAAPVWKWLLAQTSATARQEAS